MARTDEASRAARAAVSPPHLRRLLPCPILVQLGPTPAQQLRAVLNQLTGPRASLYRRLAQQALESGESEAITDAYQKVKTEVIRCYDEADKMHRLLPNLYPKPQAPSL